MEERAGPPEENTRLGLVPPGTRLVAAGPVQVLGLAKVLDFANLSWGPTASGLEDRVDPQCFAKLGLVPGEHTRKFVRASIAASSRAAASRLAGSDGGGSAASSPVVLRSHGPGDREDADGWVLVQPPPKVPVAALPLPRRFAQLGGGVDLCFTVNGVAHRVAAGSTPLDLSLAEYLRYVAGLTGTKIGCGEGGCGACSVLLRTPGAAPRLANACLRPLYAMQGAEVVTVEGVGTVAEPHPIQRALVRKSASQCGMCTPGVVMAIYAAAKRGPKPEDVELCIQGNLCRCTGYRPIYAAAAEILRDGGGAAAAAGCGEAPAAPLARGPATSAQQRGGLTWLDCATLADALAAVAHYWGVPHRLVVGNTSSGVVKYYPPHPSDSPSVFIHVARVPELLAVEDHGLSLSVGASVTLTSLIHALEAKISELPQLAPIVKHLKLVAHPQVRDVACWAGNVMLAKRHPDYPSDVCLLFVLLDADLTLVSASGSETVKLLTFLRDGAYPKPGQMIKCARLHYPPRGSFVETFKVMRRKMNTHAEVNAGFVFTFAGAEGVSVAQARVVVGNVQHTPLVAAACAAKLVGRDLDGAAIADAILGLQQDVAAVAPATVPDPPFVVSGAEYRRALCCGLLYKAALRARAARLGEAVLSPDEQSAARAFERPQSGGVQRFPPALGPSQPVGEPLSKYQGLDQACGVAAFTPDSRLQPGTLFGVPVLALSHGAITSIDAAAALQMDGVRGFVCAEDVKAIGGSNTPGPAPLVPFEVFASGAVQFLGQHVGLVLADSFAQARAAAQAVKVTHAAPAAPARRFAALGGDDSAPRRQAWPHLVVNGEPDHARPNTTTCSGSLGSSGQKHMYVECQATYAVPEADGTFTITASTQFLDLLRGVVATALGEPIANVVLQNTRLGGAYGGKVVGCVPACLAASVAAKRLKRPVLVLLDRSTDMLSLGGRAPFLAEWTVSYDEVTKAITALTQSVTVHPGFTDGGFVPSTGVNCYNITGASLTNNKVLEGLPMNYWMRAPGNMEAAFVMESAMEQVVRSALAADPAAVQEASLCPEVRPCWDAAKAQAGYAARRAEVAAYNAANRYRKQGLWCMGTRYLIGEGDYLERCAVVVNADGSVVLEHSGMELGQGMDTKAIQVCAMALKQVAGDFSTDLVKVALPRSTRQYHFDWTGTAGTAGSGTSETVCAAVADAGAKLQQALAPYRADGRRWKEVVAAAAQAGAALTALGTHEATPATAPPDEYYVYAAAVAHVEIDVLTGETEVLSFDCVYDAGRSLNPAVDIGQIEGCIMQSLGFCLTEEVVRSPLDGRVVNCGTWDYKVPTGLDIPIRLNVTLLEPAPDAPPRPTGFLSSKATGEPAMLIGAATFFAVKDAIYAARRDTASSHSSSTDWFRLDPPASVDKVQAACGIPVPAPH